MTSTKLTRAFLFLGLVALALLLAAPWAERRRLSAQVVDEVVAVSNLTFDRPSHRSGASSQTSVAECLSRSLMDAGLARPPTGFAQSHTDGGALGDGGAAWLSQQAASVALVRRCLEAPRVGEFDEFGVGCGPLDRSLVLHVTTSWLRAEALGLVDGGSPFEACLDATALERDGPALGGLIGAMFAGQSARQTTGPCLRALAALNPSQRRTAAESLERIARSHVSFSTVLRLERAISSVAITGSVLAPSDVDRLPASARACRGTLGPTAVTEKMTTWALLPAYWHRMVSLIRIAETDALLESAKARRAMEERQLVETVVGTGYDSDWSRFARRAANVPRKTTALLALLEVLEGRPLVESPWLKGSVSDGGVHLEVEFDDGWSQYDVGLIVSPR
jgi:hypothetical protein